MFFSFVIFDLFDFKAKKEKLAKGVNFFVCLISRCRDLMVTFANQKKKKKLKPLQELKQRLKKAR